MEDLPDPYSGLLSFINPLPFESLMGILIMFGLLFISALVSGSEVAFFSLSHHQIEGLKKGKQPVHKVILDLLDKPKRLLATILITNNVVNIGIIVLSTFVFQAWLNYEQYPILGFLVQIVLVTFVILLFAEVLPKVYASHHPQKFAALMASPMMLLRRLFYPLSSLLVHSTRAIDHRLDHNRPDISMDELSHVLEITSDEETTQEDKNILRGIVRYGDIEAREIMQPRMDVVSVEMNTPFAQLLQIITDAGYSRIPVFRENFDNVEGILYIKDLLPYLDKEEDFHWQNLVRNCFFVPENKKINDLLKEFQEKKIHLAVVVDEYGGTSGIVTLEDILEEIVGEINDEFDIEETSYTRINDHTYIFEGKTQLQDFCKITEMDYELFEEVKGESDTLAGLILEIKHDLPHKGEIIKFMDLEFEVESVDKRRIKKIKVVFHRKPVT